MKFHIHWFKKTTRLETRVGSDIWVAQYYDCRCGEVKIENFEE
jgi:NADH:ubiquinone oxidoreductase subunit